MYDILQLNDMLLPQLIEIAESLKITGLKKLDKQNLIYKILDKQAILDSAVKETGKTDNPVKKKRIVKTTTVSMNPSQQTNKNCYKKIENHTKKHQ